MTPRPYEPGAAPDPTAVLGWALEHPRHFLTAAWLASVCGARTWAKPTLGELVALVLDLREHGPKGLDEFVARVFAALPPSAVTPDERHTILSLALPQLEPLEYRSAIALICWCRQRRQHVSTAWWLLSVHGAITIERPDLAALERLASDAWKSARDDLFERVAEMIGAIPPGVATAVERRIYREMLDWIQLDSEGAFTRLQDPVDATETPLERGRTPWGNGLENGSRESERARQQPARRTRGHDPQDLGPEGASQGSQAAAKTRRDLG